MPASSLLHARPRYGWVLLVGAALVACQPEAEEAATATDTGSSTGTGADATTTTTTTSGASGASGTTTTTTAATEGATATDETAATTLIDPPAPEMGLRAEYFAGYREPALVGVDAVVDFPWGADAPAGLDDVDRFSVRWTGRLRPPHDGTYTLITETDDGVRLWVDGELVIDDWNGHFVARNEAEVELSAGVEVDLRIDYFEIDLDASAKLLWSSDRVAEEVIPQASLIAADGLSDLGPPKPPYYNPVEAFDCPDPGALAVDEADGPAYYKVCTGGAFPIRRSRDLVVWSATGAKVLPEGKPAWAANGKRNWAPELHRVGDSFVVYYTTVNGADVLSVGAAHADAPLGPYTDIGGPLVEHPLGVIDAHYFDDDGTPWLLYKIDGNSQGKPTPILIRQLAADGLSLVGPETTLLVNDGQSWEGGVVEAPWLVRRGDWYYLFYSGNVYDHRYRTGVARSQALLGPYARHGAPILTNNERWVGPGHGSVIDVGGLDYFVYHAWTNKGDGTHKGDAGRSDLVDRIVWEGGWPKIHDGSPSHSRQPWPGESW